MPNTVCIIDYGSSLTQILARKVREAGVYSEIHPCTAGAAAIAAGKPAAIILSGCPSDGPEDGLIPPGVPVLAISPETHSGEESERVLHNFLFAAANITPDWTMASFIERVINETRIKVGDAGRVICALSGGVDSTVVAVLLHKALGDRLHCVFVDHGLLRMNEGQEVTDSLQRFGLNLRRVQAQNEFLDKLRGVEDPERKRRIIGHTFIEIFEREAGAITREYGEVRFLAQGTVYPDVIESVSPRGAAAVIKSHHNVGGLPERMNMELVEPLRNLFKDEVRKVGAELGIPDSILWRHPFPGPGLAIRVIGEVVPERLDILRQADAIVQAELRRSGWYSKVWQGFAVLLPLRTVGVTDGNRTYEHVIALRVVDSLDAMTAGWSRLPAEVLAGISTRIIHEVKGVNRVVYDISSKPPSTIEWE